MLTAVLMELSSPIEQTLFGAGEKSLQLSCDTPGFGLAPIVATIANRAHVAMSELPLAFIANVVGDPSRAVGLLSPNSEIVGFAAWLDRTGRFRVRATSYTSDGKSRSEGYITRGQLHISEMRLAGRPYLLAIRPLAFGSQDGGTPAFLAALNASHNESTSFSGQRGHVQLRMARAPDLRQALSTLQQSTGTHVTTWGRVKTLYR